MTEWGVVQRIGAMPNLLRRATQRLVPALWQCRTASSTAETQMIAFGEGLPGHVTGPQSTEQGVVLVQEWWGVTDQMKRFANFVAENAGTRVLIPDLYGGKVDMTVQEAQHDMENLDFQRATREIGLAAKHLRNEGCQSVGVLGMCMGGALAVSSLQHESSIDCGVTCYGVPPSSVSDVSKIEKPLQGHFGKEDNLEGFSDVPAARFLEEQAREHAEVFVYDGVGHAFLNDDPSPFSSFEEREKALGFKPYDERQATLAWKRIIAFLRTHLASQ